MHAVEAISALPDERAPVLGRAAAIDARGVARSYGARQALVDVSLAVAPGEVHALLGPNGAGKTTLLRILGGMMRPDRGSVTVLGVDATRDSRSQRALVGLVPAGDRSFYLRISGLENLVFFARLHGFRSREARRRALGALEAVGLEDAAGVRAGEYSHGMQKRLSVARALLTEPRVLLVDEATHDLDPHAARVVRELVQRIAADGTAVLWATQRLDEIRDFAHEATLLRGGEVCFAGSVAKLASRVRVTRHVLRLRATAGTLRLDELRRAVAGAAELVAAADDDVFLLDVLDGATLGEALGRLTAAGVEVLSCREVRSEIEEAFVQLTARR